MVKFIYSFIYFYIQRLPTYIKAIHELKSTF